MFCTIDEENKYKIHRNNKSFLVFEKVLEYKTLMISMIIMLMMGIKKKIKLCTRRIKVCTNIYMSKIDNT